MALLDGKRVLIAGVANNHSLAYYAAIAAKKAGAEIILLSLPAMQKRVERICAEHGFKAFYCDVSNAEELRNAFNEIATLGAFNGFLHSIAFSNREELQGRFTDITKANFLKTMEVSCYSLVEMSRYVENLMSGGGHIVTLTFGASHQFFPNYNAMAVAKAALETAVMYLAADLGASGIRVNAVSASPISTLSARGISDFSVIDAHEAARSPLGECASPEEVASAIVFLLSDESNGTTGEVVKVDRGSSKTGMIPVRNAHLMEKATGQVAAKVAQQQEVPTTVAAE